MSKRLTRVLSLVLTLVMFLSVSTPAFAIGGGDMGRDFGRDIGENEIRDFEPAGEIAEEEELDYFQTTVEANGSQVTVEAPMGALPTLAELRAETVEVEDVREAVESVVEGEPNILLAMDISFWLNGIEIEPEEPVRVKISAPELEGKSNLTLVHIPDAAEPETVELIDEEDLSFALGTNEIAFQADSFSIYAVIGGGEGGDEARATVEFYGLNDAKVATYYVKNSDQLAPADPDDRQDNVQYLDDYVVDPGVGGQVPAGQIFVGWYINDTKDFTVTTAPKTIAQVREALDGMTLTEGQVIKVWAMIFKVFTITYLDEHDISIGTDEVRVLPTVTSAPYKITKDYTPVDPNKNFAGWETADGGSISDAKYEGESVEPPYKMGTTMTVSGDITFTVNAPKGRWLTFDENGKGATYNAPQFVKEGAVTAPPRLEMVRLGYEFLGWYTEKYADNATVDETKKFEFSHELPNHQTIYAAWKTVDSANYTVIFWVQNVNGDGYDFGGSQTKSGAVGTEIDVSSSGSTVTVTGDITYAVAKGFSYDKADTGKTVAPEGSTVVNVYIKRNSYTLTFIDNSDGKITYTYGGTSYSDATIGNKVTGSTTTIENNKKTVDGYEISRTGNQGNRSYYIKINGSWYQISDNGYYVWNAGAITAVKAPGGGTVKTINALFEQSIAAYFPIEGDNGYTYDNGERWKPGSNGLGWSEVMVFVETMPNENVTFTLDEADRPLKTMYFYIEALPTDTNTVTRGGVRYTLYNTISARYNGVTAEDFSDLDGFSKGDAAATITGEALQPHSVSGLSGQYYIASTTQDQSIYFFYTREKYDINFMDGLYIDGDDNPLTEDYPATGQFKVVSDVVYGSDISSYNKDGSNYYEPEHKYPGFVLEGWYIDDACTTPYTFTTEPKGGVTVYAKWRQIQYRVFLHPEAKIDGVNDTTLDWGDTEENPQKMNFRIDYMGQLSIPTGLRQTYEFIGWFTADGQPFNVESKFTEDLVKTDYDKTDPANYTDEMNKWGEIVDPDTAFNSDLTGWDHDHDKTTPGLDRYWITKKIDLYAKWSAFLPGALGIGVIYDANGGTNAPTDTRQYKDNVNALAGTAPTPKTGERFLYWVVQDWDEATGKYVDTNTIVYPGAPFTVLKSLARETDLPEEIATEDVNKAYTMQLRAEYGKAETPDDTHITFYANGGNYVNPVTGDGIVNGEVTMTYVGLQINQAVVVPTADHFTRPGYNFVGWARLKEPDDAFDKETQAVDESKYSEVTELALWLKAKDNGKYDELNADSSVKAADITEVAADEAMPYQALYAVWEYVGLAYIFHSSDGTVEMIDFTQLEEGETIDLTAKVKEDHLYGGYYSGYLDLTDEDVIAAYNAGEPATDDFYDGSSLKSGDVRYWTKSKAFTASGDELEPAVNAVYYLKEVPEEYLTSRLTYVYGWSDKALKQLYLLTVVDDSYYSKVQFLAEVEEEGSEHVARLVSSFTVTIENHDEKWVNKATDFAGVSRGYVGYSDVTSDLLKAGITFTMTPQWITLDDVTVSGTGRSFTITELTVPGLKEA